MKKKFDFVLDDDLGIYRTIFRFYPRHLYVHSFNDVPPKSWEKVYKVYYSWAIIRQYYEYKDDDSGSKIVHEESDVLLDFGFGCEECSMLPDLAAEIEYVIKTGKTYDHPTFGQPADEWRIEKHEGNDCTGAHYEYYHFQVFNNFTNQGFRFVLDKDKTLKFCDWLDMINQYVLEHGEGI